MSDNLASSSSWSETDDKILRTAIMDLHRLLHCMEQDEAPPDLTWQSIEGRANLATSLFHKVQQGWRMAVYENESLRAQDQERYVQLERQVDQACRRAREIAAERKEKEVDIIQEIFFPKKQDIDSTVNEEKKESSAEEEEQDAASVEQHNEQKPSVATTEHRRPQSPARPLAVPRSNAQDVEELQKAQREQLEEEIAHMAARLKESTQSMNTTLRAQTEELGEMEDLATKNVDKVGTVADNVTEHNKKSWRSTLATWTILFAVLGSFLFCMMTIRMVPKQRNKCLFFCGITQKEVCNPMDDGSIVCVDKKGKPYVKAAAPVSRRESEEVEHDEEREVGDDGECAAPLATDSDDYDAQDDESVAEEEETSADDVCREEGECKARYDDDPEPSDEQNEDVVVDAERTVVMPQDEESPEQFEDDEQVEVSPTSDDDEAEVHATSHEIDEDLQQTDAVSEEEHHANNELDDGKTAADNEAEQSSGGAHMEHVETKERDALDPEAEPDAVDMEVVDSVPVKEPVSQPLGGNMQEEAQQERQPTVEEREASFKPAEISTLHESFDDMDEKHELTFREAQLAAHWGKDEALKEYLHLMPHYAWEKDENGWQLMHEAAAGGHMEIMAMLLDEYNADINARVGLVNDGATPLFLAYTRGHDESSEVVRFIKDRGGVNIAPGENTPYKPASAHTPEELDQYNMKDFHLAAARGDDVRVAQYVEARPDLISAADDNGWIALHESVRYGHIIATRLLINAGSDVNARTGHDNKGWTPLGLALERLGEENPVTQLLRQHEAEARTPEE